MSRSADITPTAASGPVRTCVGCRERDAQTRLLRVVVSRGRLVADERRRLPGRGAYVHLRARCVERAARGGFARGLRTKIRATDVTAVAELVSRYGEGDDRPRTRQPER